MMKLRSKGMRWFIQHHPVRKWSSWDPSTGSWTQSQCVFHSSRFFSSTGFWNRGGTNCRSLASFFFFFFLIYLFIYFWLCWAFVFVRGLFSSCGKWGPLFIAARGPLITAASLAAEHRLQTRRLSSCGSRAQLLCGMWDPPRPGLEPVSPALAGRFSTTAPPGKPAWLLFDQRTHSLREKGQWGLRGREEES